MFLKIYRYRIPPSRVEAFRSLQMRSEEIYRNHPRFRAVYLQDRHDPAEWTEIHLYADEDTYRSAQPGIDRDPHLARLWREFLMLLDPARPNVREDEYSMEMDLRV